MLESIALGMLLEKDLTGYDIKKFIENEQRKRQRRSER